MISKDDVLSQEESDALLAESGPDSGASDQPPQTGIRDVDLSLWDQVALDRIPAFEAINDDVAEAIDATWSAMCKRSIHTSPQGAQHIAWRKYLRDMDSLMSVNLFEIQPLGQTGLLVLRRETVYAMVDLFFGGNAHGTHDTQASQLTQMEIRLAQRFTQMLTPLMEEAWSHHVPIQVRPSDALFDPDTTHVASPSESIVLIRFGFDIRDTAHVIDLLLPAKLIGKLKSQRFSNASEESKVTPWNEKITDDLRSARISLRAVMGEIEVNLGDIVNARPGDIFTSESLTTVRVFAGNQAILEGTLGAHRGHHAVKVKSPVARKYLGEING